MKLKIYFLLIVTIAIFALHLNAQDSTFKPAKVDFDAYEKLIDEVKEHRKTRLINFNEFKKVSQEDNVIILDTRSDAMYNSKHIKGAIHLNFSDFAQNNLAKIIPNFETKILIYCNNNLDGDQINFLSKVALPRKENNQNSKQITLALNIPTYINLYGYGYRNVYELSELVSISDKRLELEGTSIIKR